MSENRYPCSGSDRSFSKSETVCIDTNRVLDSCRDRDCFEDVKVLLTDFGNDIIEHTTSIRAKDAHIAWTQISIEPIKFNKGFYSVNIKFFVKLCFEACLCGGKSQYFDGITVLEKKVILYGSESNVNVFKSSFDCADFCADIKPSNPCRNVPTAVVEVVDPIILNTKVREPEDTCCCCCCCCGDIPTGVAGDIGGQLCDSDGRYLTVSLGLFSVVRIVRPAQYLINATEYCVPDKICISAEEDDPCSVFRNMAFPTSEFCPPDFTPPHHNDKGGKCGCGN
ncbi:MAG: hypothetical protein E7653_00600 [Ruminococcaceae bacterium]|nr:hypothetical protein [Oscillospiraceae bacterium]